ncbi:MAG: phosphoribosylamine--glycine ligase [Alphaproteobacteria bacterium]|nr:phosphoribosylamine--glycine ligase [Alphaproteobacteria bacterium]
MKVLVLGAGGREHALAWSLAASPLVDKLYAAPGNAGIAEEATCLPFDVMDFARITQFCKDERIGFVMVGPEAPLCAGIVDHLEANGIAAFGPNKSAARLEGSKAFMKELCARHNIPTAAFGRFTDLDAASRFIDAQNPPIVVKADGLAAGKGVIIAETREAAKAAASGMLSGGLGAAGREVVIEEFMAGEELSYFALADGTTLLELDAAQDHKRVFDGDQGPNTGGMGAYSPAPLGTQTLKDQIRARIAQPLVDGLAEAGVPYKGVLFAGIMVTRDGPKLLEINCRFGDPETQVLMPRLMSDPLPALIAARDGALKHVSLRWHDEAALCVVLASNGYPGAYQKGTVIRGLDAAAQIPNVTIFHAGTKRRDDGALLSDGGRVLNVVGKGATVKAAQDAAYAAVARIDWPEGFCRRDIGWRAVKR